MNLGDGLFQEIDYSICKRLPIRDFSTQQRGKIKVIQTSCCREGFFDLGAGISQKVEGSGSPRGVKAAEGAQIRT